MKLNFKPRMKQKKNSEKKPKTKSKKKINLQFNNTKTVTKLFAGFLVFALLIGVVGFLNWSDIHKVQQGTEEIYAQVIMPDQHLDSINDAITDVGYEGLKYSIVTSEEKKKAVRQNISKNLDTIRTDLEEYKKFSVTNEQQENIKRLEQGINTYAQYVNNYIKLIDNDEKDSAEALVEGIVDRTVIETTLHQLAELNQENAERLVNEAGAVYSRATKSIIFLSLLAVLLAIGIAFFLAKNIATPLATTAIHMKEMAQGDFTRNVSADLLKRQDEVGIMAQGLDEMVRNISELLAKIIVTAREVNEGSQKLSLVAEDVVTTTQETSAATEEVAAGLEEVSAATEQVTASGQEIGAALEEVNREMNDSTEQIRNIEQKALTIQQEAQDSTDNAHDIYETIEARVLKAIDEARVVEEISNLATNIGGIADQTNLLALNAAIEAARAGEQGRGFAVVAEEVRHLAEQSAATVSGIHKLTGQVQAAITNLVESSNELLKFIDEMALKELQNMNEIGKQYANDANSFGQSTGKVAELINNVVNAFNEINRAIESIASTITESSAGGQQVARGTEKNSQAMIDVSETSARLAEMAGDLQEMVEKFKINQA